MGRALRLLMVEDSSDDVQLTLRELARADYDVTWRCVQAPADLRDALDRETWDIVLSDFRMPGFSGTDALRLVRERGSEPPFIFVSGTIGEDAAVAAMRAGAQDYVLKENLKRLAPAVERELSEAAVRRQQRSAEARLQATTEILRAMFDASPLAFIASDLQGVVRSWNPAAERLFGWTAAEAIGERYLTVPPEQEDAAHVLRDRALRGMPVLGQETRRRKRDGTWVEVSLSLAPIFDPAREPEGFMMVYQDITDRKRLEAQYLQAQKMEAVGQLAAGVAHDFNNLLTVIMSCADFALNDLREGDKRREDVAEIQRAADAGVALTRQLLLFSRQKPGEATTVDVHTVLADAARFLTRVIGTHVGVVLALEAEQSRVEADAGQLGQLVMNLGLNSRDAMADGGTLRIATRVVDGSAAELDDAARKVPGPHLALTISDTGTGMPEEVRARVFEPFFTTKAPGTGSGLGLATVYAIATKFGGFVRVESAVGKGTAFTVFLPLVEGKA